MQLAERDRAHAHVHLYMWSTCKSPKPHGHGQSGKANGGGACVLFVLVHGGVARARHPARRGRAYTPYIYCGRMAAVRVHMSAFPAATKRACRPSRAYPGIAITTSRPRPPVPAGPPERTCTSTAPRSSGNPPWHSGPWRNSKARGDGHAEHPTGMGRACLHRDHATGARAFCSPSIQSSHASAAAAKSVPLVSD